MSFKKINRRAYKNNAWANLLPECFLLPSSFWTFGGREGYGITRDLQAFLRYQSQTLSQVSCSPEKTRLRGLCCSCIHPCFNPSTHFNPNWQTEATKMSKIRYALWELQMSLPPSEEEGCSMAAQLPASPPQPVPGTQEDHSRARLCPWASTDYEGLSKGTGLPRLGVNRVRKDKLPSNCILLALQFLPHLPLPPRKVWTSGFPLM